MKSIHIFSLTFILLGCSTTIKDYKHLSEIKVVTIDPDKYDKFLDISPYLEEEFEIIPLETNEDCILSQIKKIEVKNDKLYISDNTLSGIYVFDMEGKFVQRIGNKGSGPEEFVYMGDFSIEGNNLYIQDIYGYKYLVYDILEDTYNSLPYKPHHLGHISFDKNIYFISNYFPSDLGNFNLFRLNMENNEITNYLPFSKHSSENNSTWILNHYASKYRDQALVIYPLNDTIYSITEDEVYPEYIFHFTKRNIPTDINNNSNMMNLLESGYVSGMQYIQNSKDYIWGTYIDKKHFRYLFMDKKNLTPQIGEYLVINSLGGILVDSYYTTSENDFITSHNADILKSNWENLYNQNQFQSNSDKEKIRNIIDKINDEGNPLIFRFKIREP
jgi:hypothetical protein